MIGEKSEGKGRRSGLIYLVYRIKRGEEEVEMLLCRARKCGNVWGRMS